MKTFNEIRRTAQRMFALMLVACPLAVSCYDDSKLREQIDMLVDRVFALEEQLNAEIKTLKGLLDGQLFITSVTTENNVTNVVLSDSTVLQLLPQKDLKSFVTYVTITDGTDCWAYIDETGVKKLFLDENNHPIPVRAEMPEVIVRDDETWLVVGGSEYPLSGNSVFSDYELITDEETGEVLAVTFTFGEAMSFTVTVNAAQGFWFVKEANEETVKYDSYFVPVNGVVKVQVKSKGVEDYVVQVPDGWKYREVEDKVEGKTYFEIFAPTAEAMASGASSEGNLKVLAVLQGGKASSARLYLTTNPFKTMNVSYGKLTIEGYPGLDGYVYGFCTASDYDSDAVLAGLKSATKLDVMETDIVSAKIEDLTELGLVVATEYVVWAVPVTKSSDEYHLVDNLIIDTRFDYSTVNVEIVSEDFIDAVVKMDLAGVSAYCVGVEIMDDFDQEVVLAGLNADIYTSRTTPMTYEGSVFELTSVSADHSTDYVLWFTVYKENAGYVADDIIVIPFKTSTFAAGGTTKITVDESAVKSAPTWVSVPISAEGAGMIFYTYLKGNDKLLSGTDEELVDYLLKKGVQVPSDNVVAGTADEGVGLKLKDETDVVLVALAVDENGKYGSILKYDCATSPIIYNDMDVNISLLSKDPGDVRIKFSTSDGKDGVEYLYWVGLTTDNFWKSSTYLGGTAETAEKYIVLNGDNYRFADAVKAYPISEDGVLTCPDLTAGAVYVVVCAVKDADGIYSHAEVMKFDVYSRKLGTIVKTTDSKWEAARPEVGFIEDSFYVGGEYGGGFSFTVLPKPGFTAYVIAGAISGVEINSQDGNEVVQPDLKMLYVMNEADHSRDHDIVVDESLWLSEGYPSGHAFYRYPHGLALYGYGVIWADAAAHALICGEEHPETFKSTINMKEVVFTNMLYYNDGNPVTFVQHYGLGNTEEVVERVYVVCQDASGNCYETFEFDVDPMYYVNAPARDER